MEHIKRLTSNDANVPRLFEQQVSSAPQAVALRYRGESTTYSEVNEKANQLAGYLREHGVEQESVVGFCLRPSQHAIIAILAILKAGGTYVALDPNHPTARHREIVEDSQPVVIITTKDHRSNIENLGRITIGLDWDAPAIRTQPSANLLLRIAPDAPAYITYTSGSTGKANGIVLSHRSIINGLNAPPFNPRAQTVCSLNSPLSVGFSVSRIFLPLLLGVRLVIMAEEEMRDIDRLASVVEAERVTSLALITPLFAELVRRSDLAARIPHIETMAIGGASVTAAVVERFRKLYPQSTLLDGYGASEIGGAAIVWAFDPHLPGPTQTVFPNTYIYVLDETLTPVRAEEIGHLYVAAQHLSAGYVGQPSLTAQRFLPNPFQDGCEKLFATGDLARWSKGQIQLIGRSDEMVKIRGFRVDLKGVSMLLETHEDVQEAVVLPHEVSADPRLLAYIVRRSKRISTSDVFEYLCDRIPSYMIPSNIIALTEMPRTPSGKVDRQALAESRHGQLERIEYVPPRTSVETGLCGVWSEVLGIQNIGSHDDFFELGGHSIMAIQVTTCVFETFGVLLPADWAFSSRTVAELARIVDAKLATLETDRG